MNPVDRSLLMMIRSQALRLGKFGMLALSVCLTGAAEAQVVNDPSEGMIYRQPSRFQRVQESGTASGGSNAAAESRQPDGKAGRKKGEEKAAEENRADGTTPSHEAPPVDMSRGESAQSPADAKPKAAQPLKARAVMVDINSNNLNYDKEHDVYVATGSVHMVISEQNSELYADKLTYDQNQNLAIAEGSVVIIRDGQRTDGSYAKIDLTRRSALIHDPLTTISAVRVKAKQSFVNRNEIIMEDGRLIISGIMYQQFARQGGFHNLGQNAGKGSNQARLRRAYSKRVYQNRDLMLSQLTYDQQQTYKALNDLDSSNQSTQFEDTPDKVSRFSLKAKEIEVVRHDDGYDDINLKHASLYAGRFKLFNLPDSDFSYDETFKNTQYLGPDIGVNRAYGGAYAGPGWDFHLGRGSLRVSPIVSYGSPGFWSSNGKDGKQISNGLGFGGAVHYRDPDTSVDLAYNSHVGSPIFFADRRVYGDSVHLMVSHNDVYQNGLMGQTERPTYIAQLTDYRVLKDMGKFQLTSFESIGYAKDNFFPNFRSTYFVDSDEGASPQTLGRAQLQFQVANTAPLMRFGKYASLGMRAQLLTSAYTSSDFLALGRIGPTLSLNLLNSRWQSNLGYTVSHSIGKSPFVFDSYYGGSQNVTMNNLIRLNKYVSLGNMGSFSLNRDNAKNALAVGNVMYMMVGPQDLKATIGYDFVNSRSYFGFNFYPGPKNTVVNFDKLQVVQPANYTQVNAPSTF